MSKLNLSVPQKLTDAVKERDRRKARDAKRDIGRRLSRLLKDAEIDRARLERFDEIWKAAGFIFGWRDWFADIDAGQDFFRAYGDDRKTVVHIGKFWLGEPTGPTDRVCHARLLLNGNPRRQDCPAFLYEELHKGQVSRTIEIDSVTGMVSLLHPDFILEVHARLMGPDAWTCFLKDIENALPR